MAVVAPPKRPHHVSRFSFSRTPVGDLDIEWLLDNSAKSEMSAAAPWRPTSPISIPLDDLPFTSPRLPTTHSTDLASMPPSLETLQPSPPETRHRSRVPQPRLALSTYSFPGPRFSEPSDPTSPSASTAVFDESVKVRPEPHKAPSSATLLVELDEFFPRRPDPPNVFPTFSSIATTMMTSPHLSSASSISSRSSRSSSTTLHSPQLAERKPSDASSFFSFISPASSSSRSRSTSSQSSRSARPSTTPEQAHEVPPPPPRWRTDEIDLENRVAKLAAYPRYVPPKPSKDKKMKGSDVARSESGGKDVGQQATTTGKRRFGFAI
ncbi:hypothetical protein JCM10212_002245 [Sporobolomyces blumeae]